MGPTDLSIRSTTTCVHAHLPCSVSIRRVTTGEVSPVISSDKSPRKAPTKTQSKEEPASIVQQLRAKCGPGARTGRSPTHVCTGSRGFYYRVCLPFPVVTCWRVVVQSQVICILPLHWFAIIRAETLQRGRDVDKKAACRMR